MFIVFQDERHDGIQNKFFFNTPKVAASFSPGNEDRELRLGAGRPLPPRWQERAPQSLTGPSTLASLPGMGRGQGSGGFY